VATEVALGPLYAHALEFAVMAHAGQVRKGTSTPYFAHVTGVSALVLEHGGTEKEAIAGLLHDVVEDSENVEDVAKLIQKASGKKVRNIVSMGSDTTVHPKPPWLERKRLDSRGDDDGSNRLVHQLSTGINRLEMVDPRMFDELCA
jgi:(p)ppGpp synthase/HD superfamily hydrolase